MLSILGRRGRLCDGWSRREMIQVGTLGLFGIGLPELLRREATGQDQPISVARGNSGFGRARSVILLYLQGAPSHIDLWDPKPDASSSIRGEFRAISLQISVCRSCDELRLLRLDDRQDGKPRAIRYGFEPRDLSNGVTWA
jgi:Protein of unknown function (DUF1501)